MAFFSRLFRYLRDIRVEACNSGAEFEREIKKERKKERKKFRTWCYEPLCFVNSSKRKKRKKKKIEYGSIRNWSTADNNICAQCAKRTNGFNNVLILSIDPYRKSEFALEKPEI